MLSACVMVRPAGERYTSPTLKSSRKRLPVTSAMLDASARRSGSSDRRLLRARVESQGPHASMDLRMAVRTKHHAAFELLSNFLPTSIDAVNRQREFLPGRVRVVEVKGGRHVLRATRPADSAKRCDRSTFRLTT